MHLKPSGLLTRFSILFFILGPAFSWAQEIPGRRIAVSGSAGDSVRAVPAAPRSDTLTTVGPSGKTNKIVKRDFDAQEQVVVGTAIMTFIIVIITTVANWNPR